LDLLQSKESLLAAIKKNTCYEIRRAEKNDDCSAEHITQSVEMLALFIEFYRKFANQKRLEVPDFKSLERLSNAGKLVLSRIVSNEETLVWHVYCCINGRARLLYSASLFRGMDSSYRNMIGRANRYLHWCDILMFKEAGYHTYDFGGWNPLKSGDFEKHKINQFKEEFGGQKTIDFNCIYATNLVGKITLAAKAAISKMMNYRFKGLN